MPRREGIACKFCHDEMLGTSQALAIADAVALGWERRPDGWVCVDCILEEGAL